MQYNRKMINGVVFLEEQADYLLLLGKEGLYTVQAENDHWNVHYTLPGDTSNLDEYSRAMKSHFRKFGNQMSGSGNHLCNYASLLA